MAILDTGYATVEGANDWRPAADFRPFRYQNEPGTEKPDADGDKYLDPVAGHGTFIAGIFEFRAHGCAVEVLDLIRPEGDGEEADVIDVAERCFQIVRHRRQKYRGRCGAGIETALGPEKLVAGGR